MTKEDSIVYIDKHDGSCRKISCDDCVFHVCENYVITRKDLPCYIHLKVPKKDNSVFFDVDKTRLVLLKKLKIQMLLELSE